MVRDISGGLPAQGTHFHDAANVIAEFLGPRDVVNLSSIPTSHDSPNRHRRTQIERGRCDRGT